ncbi:MAG TPA: NUDIX hydrolase [Acidimicrobiales bacterium]
MPAHAEPSSASTPAVAYRVAAPDELAASDDLADARAHVLAVRDAAQRKTRQRILAFVDAHPDALLRSCAPGHLTGSALVVDPATRDVLVLHHAKLRRWLQPGGHADGDANLAAVALREATEETGIDGLRVVVPAVDLDVHLVDPPGEAPHHHYDVRFLVLAPPGATAVGNHESTALRWVAAGDLDELGCDPGMHRLATAGLRALDRLTDDSHRDGG